MYLGSFSVVGTYIPGVSDGNPGDFNGQIAEEDYPLGYAFANFDITGSFAVADIQSFMSTDDYLQYQETFVSFQTQPFAVVPEPPSLTLGMSAAVVALVFAVCRALFSHRAGDRDRGTQLGDTQ